MDKMELYLKEYYSNDITNLLNETNERSHISIHIDLCRLQQHNFDLFQAIFVDPHTERLKWNAALFKVQKSVAEEGEAFLEDGYQIKINCHVRFVNFPPTDARYKPTFPNHDQIGQFVEVKGNVVRMSQSKLLEQKREYVCSRCKEMIVAEAEYVKMYGFDVPRNCTKAACKGTLHPKNAQPLPKYCVDYQELKIQELLSDKNIPPSLIVTLEHDLVDSCQPGDCVTICGSIERRWQSFQVGGKCEAMMAMRAISLTREQKRLTIDTKRLSEQMLCMRTEWIENLQKMGELSVRDVILKSICPEIYGLYPIKLAIALVMCSGGIENTIESSNKLHKRGQSHLLLIGDPGMAKSKLLLSATTIAPRAVHTTGMGCSTAGLTAAAVKVTNSDFYQEDGEWQLEAGALVLADGGICCIDEFNLMRETDRASIHEAMEQQTVSMAKAGLVCKLSTRCAILAAANPKNLYSMSEPEGTSSINIGIASPLLSRFDLVYILCDERNPDWDNTIADHLLSYVTDGASQIPSHSADDALWNTERLQAHFAAIYNVQPRMSDEANIILGTYYKVCRSDPERDPARTTVRLLDSLIRLAQAHARLVFRDIVNAMDAIMVICLMESTYGFGRIVKPFDIIKVELPLGPDIRILQMVLKALNLDDFITEDEISQNSVAAPVISKPELASKIPTKQPSRELDVNNDENLDDILSFDTDKQQITNAAINANSSTRTTNVDVNVNKSDNDNDDDDLLLSQALDKAEESEFLSQAHSMVEKPSNPDANTCKEIDLNSFIFEQKRMLTSTKKCGESLNHAKLTTKNNLLTKSRRLCTANASGPDDNQAYEQHRKNESLAEMSPNERAKGNASVSDETLHKLNAFLNPHFSKGNEPQQKQATDTDQNPICDEVCEIFNAKHYVTVQQPLPQNASSLEHSMVVDADSEGEKEEEDDLSFLNSLEF